jgi:small subunit ribosomal protein S18
MSDNDQAKQSTNEKQNDNESRGGGGRRGNTGRRRPPGGRGRRGGRRRRRGCPFKVNGKCEVDYKDVDTLRMYLTDTGKIRPRRQTQACSKCQRALAVAIKRARFLALLPYAPQHLRAK